ncbi:MAG: RDD family protein [Solirubrobacteraceae bacterium]|nr:RDD family protein [Solirubrobacteraceae bacterium]
MHAFQALNLTLLNAPDEGGGFPGIPGGGPSGGSGGGLPGIPGGGPSGIPGGGSSSSGGSQSWGAPAPMPGQETPQQAQPQAAQFSQPEPPTAGGGGQVFELAGWGARFGAWLVDLILIWVILLPLFGIAGALGLDTGSSSSSGSGASFSAADGQVLGIMLLWVIAVILYAPTTMALMQGSTPGKRVLGIRVVRADGSPVTFGFAFLREVVVKGIVVQSASIVTFGLGALVNYLWPLWDSENRAVHDLVVRSRVVRR